MASGHIDSEILSCSPKLKLSVVCNASRTPWEYLSPNCWISQDLLDTVDQWYRYLIAEPEFGSSVPHCASLTGAGLYYSFYSSKMMVIMMISFTRNEITEWLNKTVMQPKHRLGKADWRGGMESISMNMNFSSLHELIGLWRLPLPNPPTLATFLKFLFTMSSEIIHA